MLKNNNIILGLFIGALLPLLAWASSRYLLNGSAFIEKKPYGPYMVAFLINLFIIQALFKKGKDQTGSGVIISTLSTVVFIMLFQRIHF